MKPWYAQLFDSLLNALTKEALAAPAGAPSVAGKVELGSGYSREAEEEPKRRAICGFMESNLGDRYTYAAEITPGDLDPETGDCSEYTEHAHLNAGLKYPDGVVNQRAFCRGRRVARPKPGDPFFFSPNPANGIPHTGIYVGMGLVIHAKGRPESKVIKVTLADIEAHPRFEGWFRHPDLAWPQEDRA